jgi:hypothetical protein
VRASERYSARSERGRTKPRQQQHFSARALKRLAASLGLRVGSVERAQTYP